MACDIMKRVVLLAAAGFASVSAAGADDTSGSEIARKPNVLFIAIDDLRPNLGCYGDEVAKTPNIDSLAKNGTLFRRAYTQQAVCNPSRASLMTGRRPDTTRVWDLHTHFRKALPDVVTLPQYFKEHGYLTQAIGKIYHDPEWAQDAQSWSVPEKLVVTKRDGKYALDESESDRGGSKGTATEKADVADDAYIDGKVAEAAVKALHQLKDKPFFLAVGFRRPHLPFSAPAKYWDMYDRDALPLPDTAAVAENVPEVALHDWAELRGYVDIPSSGALSRSKVRELIHGYYASTSFIDAQVGRVLAELARLELTGNTVVVLWSDHGYHLGEKGLWCKTTNFELDTRVPLIVSVPGQKREGSRCDALVELVDLYPTLVELAGLPVEDGLEGVSLVPLLENPNGKVKEAAFSQFARPHNAKGKEPQVMGYSVRTEDFRYTEWRRMKSGEVVGRELYDHRRDPGERKNIAEAEEFETTVQKLSGVLN